MMRLAAIASILFAASALAGESPITLTIGETDSNPGDTVEVPISLVSGEEAPEVVILFIEYDSSKLEPVADYYEFALLDLAGNPIVDDTGTTITRRSAVRPEEALEQAEKVVDFELHPEEGVIGISMAGLNGIAIPDGLLATIAMRVLPGALPNETLALRGVDDTDPVFLFNEASNNLELTYSTAAYNEFDQDTTELPVDIVDGSVQLGCVPVATAPQAVTATQGGANAVTVSWTPGDGASTEYRVFRASSDNVAAAQPLGTAWLSATSFQDITASPPQVIDEGGCFQPPVSAPVRYYYFVKARTAAGCEGPFSAPAAIGWRGEGKSLEQQAAAAPLTPRSRAELVLYALIFAAFAVLRLRHRTRDSR